MNMPFEMGMAMYHALLTQHSEHRCAFFVPTEYDYKMFASDLAGLDPKCHYNEASRILAQMYEWLRSVVPSSLFNSQPTAVVLDRFSEYKQRLSRLKGGGENGVPSHEEAREVMYQFCAELAWIIHEARRCGLEAGLPAMIAASTARARRTVAA
jgi:hypothetical protein